MVIDKILDDAKKEQKSFFNKLIKQCQSKPLLQDMTTKQLKKLVDNLYPGFYANTDLTDNQQCILRDTFIHAKRLLETR